MSLFNMKELLKTYAYALWLAESITLLLIFLYMVNDEVLVNEPNLYVYLLEVAAIVSGIVIVLYNVFLMFNNLRTGGD